MLSEFNLINFNLKTQKNQTFFKNPKIFYTLLWKM